MIGNNERGRRPIHTAGCLIIGDEVLGGKVESSVLIVHFKRKDLTGFGGSDHGHQFSLHGAILLLAGITFEAHPSHRRR